jgi:hypothetical protein
MDLSPGTDIHTFVLAGKYLKLRKKMGNDVLVHSSLQNEITRMFVCVFETWTVKCILAAQNTQGRH